MGGKSSSRDMALLQQQQQLLKARSSNIHGLGLIEGD